MHNSNIDFVPTFVIYTQLVCKLTAELKQCVLGVPI